MYEKSLLLLQEINKLGFEAYIVGGFARDKYLGINSTDIDICTNMSFLEAKKYFKITDITNYGTYKIQNYEIATFRKDLYNNSRYPSITYVATLDEDLLRRDFIINTLCIDYKGNYVDKLGAMKDLDLKIIRTVKDSDVSFKEDPLRIVRALRLQIDLNFKLSSDIIDSIKKNISLLGKISQTRIIKEINKSKNKDKLMEVIKYERESY